MATKLKTLGTLNLTAAATAQQLSTASLLCESFTVTAAAGNTGAVVIGDSTVTTANSAPIAAGGSRTYTVPEAPSGGADYVDLQDVYFDGATTGNDIFVDYFQRQH